MRAQTLWLLLLTLGVGACDSATLEVPARPDNGAVNDAALLEDISQRTFRFFWERAHPRTGLVPDRWPTKSFASIAATGFGLTAYAIGAERGWVTRPEARDRTLLTLRFLAGLPQGPEPAGRGGYQGFFYHFLDQDTGLRFERVELSTVDTALLIAGALTAAGYFTRDDPAEREIRDLADRLYRRIDWRWAQVRAPLISMGWKPESGFIAHDYHGYDEAMILYLLALGSPTHAVEPAAWQAYTDTYSRTWGTFMGQQHLGGAPLFWHQYSHLWVDFRGIRDAYMRDKGLDYFENARRATLAQREYAIANPGGWRDHGADVWGLTASDGPGHILAADHQGRRVQFHGYAARGAGLRDTLDDGTIAPTAAAGSLPFAPEVVIPAVQAMHQRYGEVVYSTYGFTDAFNRSFATAVKVEGGLVVPGWGWVGTDYVGIDQGPIIGMIANYRDELVWKHMRQHPALRRGLQRAGFDGGWLGR